MEMQGLVCGSGTAEIPRSKIICTIGPSSVERDVMRRMADAGMAIARLNFSHGDQQTHKKTIEEVKQLRASNEKYRAIAIAVDTKGPEIRTGVFKEKSVQIKAGDQITLTTNEEWRERCGKELVYVDHKDLPSDLRGCDRIYIDDGKLELKVTSVSVEKGEICVEALNDSALSSRKGVNVPGAILSFPAMTKKDEEDIAFAVENEADFIFASFVRKKADVECIRRRLGSSGIKVVSKIENREGLLNLDEIMEASDGIMIARGDMGIEVDYHNLFAIQRVIQERCVQKGVPFAVATQMLESMTQSKRPTRAEITDVGFASMSAADCIMLSGETASGRYPAEAVSAMREVSRATFSFMYKQPELDPRRFYLCTDAGKGKSLLSQAEKILEEGERGKLAKVTSANASVIYVLSQMRTGFLIVVVSDNEKLLRKLAFLFGCHPVYSPEEPKGLPSHEVVRSPRQITVSVFG